MAPAVQAADPGRWAESGRSTIPLYYYQGVTADPATNLYFDGVYSGLYRTDRELRETARNDDVIPPPVRAAEGYNHIGDITWDAAEGGRILLPLECYYPGTPDGGNSCKTGSIGVADPKTLQWRYYVKLDPRDIKKAMWSEVSPDGTELWTSSGRDLLVYSIGAIASANAAPSGVPLRPVRKLSGAVPPSGITGATFYEDGRLYVAGQGAGPFQVWSIDPAKGSRRLEIEREIVGESEGLAVFESLGGVLHWQIQPYNEGAIPTFGVANGTLLHFVPVAPDVADGDGDGILDQRDNCPGVPNADQANSDGDARGEACDLDDDNDTVPDSDDNCPSTADPNQANSDADPQGDACDADDDNDGVPDASDGCRTEAGGGTADGCPAAAPTPSDPDRDGIADSADNCPGTANADQANADSDADGDLCDSDDDNDGVADTGDNCRSTANRDQANSDADPDGNACDSDDDNDGHPEPADNCAETANSSQVDSERDGQGDACDPDDDNDGVSDGSDSCRTNAGAGTPDGCPAAAGGDSDRDRDGIFDSRDNCATIPNPSQDDADLGGVGDACDPDDDNDRLPDLVERSRGTSSIDLDSDDDGLSDGREDADRDGRLGRRETDPRRRDTDRDRLADGLERGLTRPVADPPGPITGTDRARFRADRDPRSRTSPRRQDTDRDRLADGREDRNRNGRHDRGETDPRRPSTGRAAGPASLTALT